jgi:UDP-N-acetylglucosamine:LPS N-acetylglucosamine transferase
MNLSSATLAEVLFVGTARGMESRLVPAAGFKVHLVQVGQLKNVSLRHPPAHPHRPAAQHHSPASA